MDVATDEATTSLWATRAVEGVGEAFRLYHRHRVIGMAHLQAAFAAERPVVLVGNHCFDVVDPLMFAVAVHRETGRRLRFIAHGNVFFGLPLLRTLAPSVGLIPNRRPDLADAILRAHGALMLYPGSGTEAFLRSYRREPYRLKWNGKLGFVELAVRQHATLLFVAGLGIDELYHQTDLPLPALLIGWGNAGDAEYYRGARLQLGLCGLHALPGVLPFPVRVTHVISPPFTLDPDLDPDDRAALAAAQNRLWAESQAFLDHAIAERDSDPLDRLFRGVIAGLTRFGL